MASTESTANESPAGRTPLSWAVRAGIAYLLLEIGAFAGLQLLESSLGVEFDPVSTTQLPAPVLEKLDSLIAGESTYLQHDPALGWSPRPNGSTKLYQANGQGLRGDREVSIRTDPGVVRIAAFGDSFTHGDDVNNASTWEAQLEPMLKSAQVLNFGVPAYGVDQAYLRYMEDGKSFRPNVVLIGVMTENLYRGINVWRPYYKTSYDFPLTKPRFKLVEGRLVLVPNPLANLKACERLRDDPASLLPQIAENDSLFSMQYAACDFDFFPTIRLGKMLNRKRTLADLSPVDATGRFKTEHEAFAVLTATLTAFVAAVREEQANVMVLLFPNEVLPSGSQQSQPYEPLKDWLDEAGIGYMDLQDGFDRYRADLRDEELFVGQFNHYSPAGNGLVAQALRDQLTERGWALR